MVNKVEICGVNTAKLPLYKEAEIMRKVEKAKNIFRTLDSAWGHMTDKEKQSVCQELIDRIEIHKDGVVDVHLKLRSYLIRR